MNRRSIRNKVFLGLLTTACLLGTLGLSASAVVTVDDIAEKMRELGLPEAAVQRGYNEWSTGEYTQEDVDYLWGELENFEGDITDIYDRILGFGGGTVPLPTEPTVNPTEPTGDTQGDAPDSGGTTEPTQAPTEAAPKKFADMTLEEKRNYVSGMTDAERRAFLENLTPEERKSLLKQMPVEDKAEIMQGFAGVAEEMDMHVTVDKLTEDNISLTIRDDQGTIVDKSQMGVVIDETGISHTGLLVSAAASAVLALSGLVVLGRKLGKDEMEK